jgi:hypothetical protein
MRMQSTHRSTATVRATTSQRKNRMEAPVRRLAHLSARHGRLLHWNDLVWCGRRCGRFNHHLLGVVMAGPDRFVYDPVE